MPWDTRGSSAVAAVINLATHLTKFFWMNWISSARALPTPSDTAKNPSSEWGYNPAVNLFNQSPRYAWRTKGQFRIGSTSAAVSGIRFGANNYIEITDTGGTTNLAIATGTYQDPRDLRDVLQAALNANATLDGTFTVSYTDQRTTNFSAGANANFRWNISSTVPFSMNHLAAHSILYSLGWETSVAASSAHLSHYRACHTEEHVIFDALNPYNQMHTANRLVIDDENCTALTSYRYLILEGSNIPLSGVSARAAEGLFVLLSSNANFDIASSSWVNGRNLFRLGNAGQVGVAEWRDQYLYGGSGVAETSYWIVLDLVKYAEAVQSTNLGGFSQRYIKLCLCDPHNAYGGFRLANVYLGPAYSFNRQYAIDWSPNRVDPSPWVVTDQNVVWRRTTRGNRTINVRWDEGNPMSEDCVMELNHRILTSRSDEITYTSGGSLQYVVDSPITRESDFSLRGKSFIVADAQLGDTVPTWGANIGMTRSMMRVYMADTQMQQLPGVNLWGVSFSMRESV